VIPETLSALKVPIDGLVPYGNNPRRGNVDVIVESLGIHGQYRPIVVRTKTFEVLAGNHTLAAARELGWTEIAATFVDVTDDEAARIVLVDNRAADLGAYDDQVLADLLGSLPDTAGTGFSDDDLAVLLALQDPATHVNDLSEALERADESMYPWVKVQLHPDNHSEFQAVPGDTDHEKFLHLLHHQA
jgi:ParB-like chromosome segregation protein Spo0J